MIVGRLVVTHGSPIDSFRSDARVAVTLGNLRVQLFSIGKFLLHEIDAGDGHFQARAEPILGQVAFNPVTLEAVRIHHQHRGRPQDGEPFEPGRMFLDMSFEGNECLIDEVRRFLIRV